MNKANITLKQIVCFIEGIDVTQSTYNLDKYTNISKALQEGSSVILLDRKPKNSNLSPLVSLLWFDETLSQDITYEGKLSENQLRTFESSKTSIQEKTNSNDDEENTEVKFLRNPKKLSDISDAKVCIVTQSEDIAKFAEVAEINFVYEKDSGLELDSWLEEASTKLNGLDLAILHLNLNSKSADSVNKSLVVLDGVIAKYFETSSFKIIYSSFAEKSLVSDVIGIHREQLKKVDSDVRDLIEKVIPRQTWEYTKGEVNEILVEDKENLRFCLCNYHTKINRTDKIVSFQMLQDKANWNKIGGNIIWIAGLLREIMFELGKFPKFGA